MGPAASVATTAAMLHDSQESLSTSIALGLSASSYAPIAPVSAPLDGRTPATRSARALHPLAPFRRALVVADPEHTRGRGPSIAREFCRGLLERGVPTRLHVSRGVGDVSARLATAHAGFELVVCVGGLRVLAEIFAALPSADVRVACLPVGDDESTERWARHYGLPRDVDGALEVVEERAVRHFHPVRVGNRLGLVRAGIGREARRIHRDRGLGARRGAFVVEVDGHRLPGLFANLAVLPPLAPAPALGRQNPARDALLRIELWPVRRGLIGSAVALARTWLERPPRVLSGRRVAVHSALGVPCHVDGLPAGSTPCVLELAPSPCALLSPQGSR